MMDRKGGIPGPADLILDRRLVVFDMDGTLYDQKRLRRGMALRLLAAAVRRGSVRDLRCLSQFRRLREELSEAETEGFDGVLYRHLSARTNRPEAELRALIADWICRRPLPLLRACRAPGIERLFQALARRSIRIAVWSDYPARDKLAVLELTADLVLCANDPEVGVLKPNPAGLEALLRHTGCAPGEALMIGDRVERDGAAAGRLGVPFLLYGRRPAPGVQHLSDFAALGAALERA